MRGGSVLPAGAKIENLTIKLEMKFKRNNKKILVIRKNKGKFCTVYGDDANSISMFFGYKILDGGKVGFLESVLNKVINTLFDKKISYMVIYIDKDSLVKDFKKLNNYTKYIDIAIFKLDYISKVDKLINKIKNMDEKEFNDFLVVG